MNKHFVEVLDFDIEATQQSKWIAEDKKVWTRFLLNQGGFVRKEVWAAPQKGEVRIVVWWQSREDWEKITDEMINNVDQKMHDLFVKPNLETYRLVSLHETTPT